MSKAPVSVAYYRCNWCRAITPEPHTMTETELRAALDEGRVVGKRMHRHCSGPGVETVHRVTPTIFAVLAAGGIEFVAAESGATEPEAPSEKLSSSATGAGIRRPPPSPQRRPEAQAQRRPEAQAQRSREGHGEQERERVDPRQLGLFGDGKR